MSKTPPGVKRMVSVLNFFAEHPGQAFTFTDIVKALKLGRATCHALLAGLVEEQYLYRNADKSYVIGPALVAIGQIAVDQFSPFQAAKPEMRLLSDSCNAVCSAVLLEDGDAVIASRAGSGSNLGWSVPQGYRLPLRAPFAASFFAWSKPYEVEKWLDEMSPAPPVKEREQLQASIEFTRAHGYCFGIVNKEVETDPAAPELAFTGEQREYPVISMSQLKPDADYPISFINSPVFDKQGDVAFVLNLSGFVGSVKGAQIEEMGQRLRDAAERVTQFITGKSSLYPYNNPIPA